MLPAPVSKRLPPLFDIAIDDVRGTEGESVATPTGLTGFCGAEPALAAAPMGAGEMRRWRVRGGAAAGRGRPKASCSQARRGVVRAQVYGAEASTARNSRVLTAERYAEWGFRMGSEAKFVEGFFDHILHVLEHLTRRDLRTRGST